MTTVTKEDIRRAIDRHGADLSVWPDRGLAQATRVAALADGDVRAWLSDARALAVALAKTAAAIDGVIVRSGAPGRIAEAVLTEVAANPRSRTSWIAVAATLLLAAGFGGAVQITLERSVSNTNVNVVVLDPLVFGPAGIDQ